MSSQDLRAASNPSSHPRVLSGLSRSLSREVRERVALNPATSLSLLFHLLDDDRAVSACATLSLLKKLNASTLRTLVERRFDLRESLRDACVANAPSWLNSPDEFLVSDAEFNRLRAVFGHPDPVITESHLERILEADDLRFTPPEPEDGSSLAALTDIESEAQTGRMYGELVQHRGDDLR